VTQKQNISKEILKYLVQSAKVPLLLVFTAHWSPLSEIVSVVAQKVNNTESATNVITIDIDQHENLAKEFNIGSVPSVIIIRNKQIQHKLEGVVSKKEILNLLRA